MQEIEIRDAVLCNGRYDGKLHKGHTASARSKVSEDIFIKGFQKTPLELQLEGTCDMKEIERKILPNVDR